MTKVVKFGKRCFAVCLDTLQSESFFQQSWGRQLEDWKRIREFQLTAKTAWVGAKGTPTLTAVKRWIKENKPSQFFADWQADSGDYKDDSVQIWFN